MSEHNNLYQQWADAFAAVGSSHITNDTAAKILAVVYIYGGSYEGFTHCSKLKTDIESAIRKFNIGGAKQPSLCGLQLIQKYTRELEEDLENSDVGKNDIGIFSKVCHVEWANRLFRERYGFEKLSI